MSLKLFVYFLFSSNNKAATTTTTKLIANCSGWRGRIRSANSSRQCPWCGTCRRGSPWTRRSRSWPRTHANSDDAACLPSTRSWRSDWQCSCQPRLRRHVALPTQQQSLNSSRCSTLIPLFTYGLKDGAVVAVGLAGHNARASHQSHRQIGHNVAIQIRQHHHVKLLRLRHQLEINIHIWKIGNFVGEGLVELPACNSCPQSLFRIWSMDTIRIFLCTTWGTDRRPISWEFNEKKILWKWKTYFKQIRFFLNEIK